MTTIIKIILAILLLLCLADMPYGYYQFVRFAAMAGFLYLAYLAIEDNKKKNIAVVWSEYQVKYLPLFNYVLLALLFQPFFKIALGRTIWNIVDLIAAFILIGSIYLNPKTNED
jgi:hypothetical protein